MKWGLFLAPFGFMAGCLGPSGGEGNPGAKLFLALGICLAAVFLVFWFVVKSREKE